MLDEEIVVSAGDDIDNGVADSKNVDMRIGHAELT
jgi:hypothetical protein